MKVANNVNMNGARLLNATGLSDASGNVTGTTAYAMVSTYAALIALGVPSALTLVKVDYDSNRGLINPVYQVWPDGCRFLEGTTTDRAATDYSSVGSVIDDGGGSFGGNTATVAAKSFDGDINSYYDASSNAAGKYVGRDFGSARSLNRVIITPRQDSTYCTRINGAQLQYSTNGSSWTTLYTVAGVTGSNYTQPITVNFGAVSARYVRLFFNYTDSYGNVAEQQYMLIN